MITLDNKMKILILGHSGMLGHMVVKYLQSNNINICTIDDRWPNIKKDIKNFDGDYIVNCIGAIPQRTSDFDINWELPIWLDLNSPCRVIHPGTDCEMDSDDYGISKNVASNYIDTLSKQTKSIKTSIIGPELNTSASLLEWFLSQKGEVFGYTKAMWNGNTTLQWSKQCLHLIYNWDDYKPITILEGQSISKYDMLLLFRDVFAKDDTIIVPKNLGKDKCLKGHIYTPSLKQQLTELKDFYYDY